MKHITLAYNLLTISNFIFLVSMVACFWPKHNKCLKMGSKCQIFANLRTKITMFSDLKHIMMVTQFQEMGIIRWLEIAPNEL